MTAVAVTSLVVVPTIPVEAVSTGRPTAVAVAADGTTYVGFADADGLLVLAPNGRSKGALALDGVGPVTGLAVDPAGSVWVDDGTQVVRLSRSGTPAARFPHRPAAACPADRDHDPARYGGLAVTASRVYVAGRCHAAVEVYTRAGALVATLDLPGTGLPRGIAWAPAYQHKKAAKKKKARGTKVPARLYVSLPDAGVVYGYNARSLGARSKVVATMRLPRSGGYAVPRAGGIAADDQGHVAALDVANNALQLYDAGRRYRLYRTLGHPPGAAATRGYLSRPAALAQGGAKVGRHLWVADTGNGRVQRWNPTGTTQWMADTRPPSAPGTPADTEVPTVTGSPVLGGELTCTDGTWTGAPTSYARVWLRDGDVIDGAVGAAYVVAAEDVGTELSCVVTATNAVGTGAPAASEPVTIDDGVPDPDPTPVTTCRGESSVQIDAGGRIARRPFVTLVIRAPEGAREVEISNDGFRHSDVKPLAAGCRYQWTLDGGPSPRPKVVSVRFPGLPGVARDQVVLDGAPPVIHRVGAKWITARQGWVLDIRATDRGTGITQVKVGKTRSSARTYKWPADIVSWDSSQLRWIRVFDGAGYASKWYRLRLH